MNDLPSGVVNEFEVDLIKAQSEIKNALFNAVNPFYESNYADLSSIKTAVLPAYTSNNMTVVQLCVRTETGFAIETRLIHKSGVTISSIWPIVYDNKTAQSFGSGATYARRYGLSALGLVACEPDDDANHATPKQTSKPKDDPFAEPKGDPFAENHAPSGSDMSAAETDDPFAENVPKVKNPFDD